MPDRRKHGSGALRPADGLLLGEAFAWLALAALALRVSPFQAIARLATGRARPSAGTPRSHGPTAERIARAVRAAARRAPWIGACFPQALACHIMLRRRRLPSRLFYGARNRGALGPTAHVWVCSGDLALVGAETAETFALLATFPPLRAPESEP
jgi:hypothetical protein